MSQKIPLDKESEFAIFTSDLYDSFSPDCCTIHGRARRSPQRWAFFVRKMVIFVHVTEKEETWQNRCANVRDARK